MNTKFVLTILAIVLVGCSNAAGVGSSTDTDPGGDTTEQPAACPDIPAKGCCNGQYLLWCKSGISQEIDCGNPLSCGWNPQIGEYDCGTDGLPDPSGAYPLECSGFTPRGEDTSPEIDVVIPAKDIVSEDIPGDDSGSDCASPCAGKECGQVGDCSCGSCGDGEVCVANACVDESDPCVAVCEDKNCGTFDGCVCGLCPQGQVCTEYGSCLDETDPCLAVCEGKLCGIFEGCVCGECEPSATCSADGTECIDCVPKCSDPLGNPYECGNDGCGGQCGVCDEADICQGHVCVIKPEVKIPFGGECQYLEDCQPYLDPDSSEQNPDFPFCNYDQCEGGGPCSIPFCSKSCVMHKDTVNNATGVAEGDGIEDADTPQDDCAGAVDGPVGTNFKCVALLPADQPNPVFQCQGGTTFKACVANTDCPDGEACQLAYINGFYQTRCMTAVKDEFHGGVSVGKVCNGNQWDSDLAFCNSDLCFGVGCVDFCTANSDCMTNPGATCDGGTCSNNPDFDCASDSDCSAWQCEENFQLFSSAPEITFDICFPKECGVSADCGDTDYFCRFFINGEPALVDVAWEYFCLPKPADSVGLGEACDPFWQDDIEGSECETGFCIEGFCSGVCITDADCAVDQLCVVQEYGYDHDKDDLVDKILPYNLCQSFPGSQDDCMINADCTENGEACVMAEFPSDGEFMYELKGYCANLGEQKGVMGDFCGWGVGVECKSGICQYFDNEAGYGLCVEPCAQNSDCPDTISLEGIEYKTICTMTLWGYNGTLDIDNGLFLNYCWVTYANNSLQDCSADFICTEKDNEACTPYVHSLAPNVPALVEYACVSNIGFDDENNPLPAPTKDAGEVCNPEGNGECMGIFCMNDVQEGVGYCSKLCLTDDDCPDGLECLDNVYLARPNMDNAAIYKTCRKAVSCLPCSNDYDCAPGFLCVNVGGFGITADYKCAPTCETDDDCVNTDGGLTCVESISAAGQLEGKLACIPGGCP